MYVYSALGYHPQMSVLKVGISVRPDVDRDRPDRLSVSDDFAVLRQMQFREARSQC